MSYLKGLPDDAVLLQVFKAFPATSKPLLAYHEALLRGPSPLSVAERELIAGFVSGLNACRYCHGVHEATAREFGISADVMAHLLADVDRAPVDEKLRPLLRYVKKLTLSPARMTQADADAVFAAGWGDQALHDAVSVCALFNFMNRLVEGLGIRAGEDYFQAASKRLHEGGYAGLLKLLG
ncbi:MAG: peroxidase [Betaproteobacteria bacterium RIFCSPLOWO2_02_FULL_63_19]|nr:MAG: peroxidase [Betaproteobacteria bacterium RIFCSPLOWO2_02_FULL_63_19]